MVRLLRSPNRDAGSLDTARLFCVLVGIYSMLPVEMALDVKAKAEQFKITTRARGA